MELTKKNKIPKAMDMGNAGSALRKMASRNMVAFSPVKTATMHAMVDIQSSIATHEGMVRNLTFASKQYQEKMR